MERAAEVSGREIVLVDDVYTTGTTATEGARVLRKAGAARVWVATAARTLKLASEYEELDVPRFQVVEEGIEAAETDEIERLETVKP